MIKYLPIYKSGPAVQPSNKTWEAYSWNKWPLTLRTCLNTSASCPSTCRGPGTHLEHWPLEPVWPPVPAVLTPVEDLCTHLEHWPLEPVWPQVPAVITPVEDLCTVCIYLEHWLDVHHVQIWDDCSIDHHNLVPFYDSWEREKRIGTCKTNKLTHKQYRHQLGSTWNALSWIMLGVPIFLGTTKGSVQRIKTLNYSSICCWRCFVKSLDSEEPKNSSG